MNTLPVAEKILEYLEKFHHATPQELSQTLRVTPQDVRYNLRRLVSEGQVYFEKESKAKTPGRGRPAHIYRLTNQTKLNNLIELLRTVLALYFENSSASETDLFDQIAGTLIPSPTLVDTSPVQNFNALKNKLNQHQYQAYWEARPEGPCIFFHNCPYLPILEQFPQLCEIDRIIISNFSHQTVTILQTQQSNYSGSSFCKFLVNPGNPPKLPQISG